MPRSHRIANIPQHECPHCGKAFRRYVTVKRPARFCSRACARRAGVIGKRIVSLEIRFWERVSKTDSCWIWMASCTNDGYGTIKKGGKHVLTHRLSWHMAYGPIPDGLSVLHSCDNPPCVNPDHLFLGTQKDNMRDMINKGRYVGKGNTILTDAQVREIRKRYAQGGITYAKLGSAYGVSSSAVNHIVHRRNFSRLP